MVLHPIQRIAAARTPAQQQRSITTIHSIIMGIHHNNVIIGEWLSDTIPTSLMMIRIYASAIQ
jgi:hypothetical protein